VRRIATRGRVGYCYHLNDGLGALLDALGYDVTRHVGGVHGRGGASGDEMTNHLVLTVHGLPTDANPGGDWYVDAGLGDALHEPLPLLPGRYRQPPFDLVLDETQDGVGDWHLTHDRAGSFAGMSWRSMPTGMDAFMERHRWLSTSPDSGFVRVLTVQRRDATGVDILRGLVLQRVGADTGERTLARRTELTEALGDLFRLDVRHVDEPAWDTLWDKVSAAHEAWEAAGRP
jgi:arylamine N-acetyltransferase